MHFVLSVRKLFIQQLLAQIYQEVATCFGLYIRPSAGSIRCFINNLYICVLVLYHEVCETCVRASGINKTIIIICVYIVILLTLDDFTHFMIQHSHTDI